MRQQLENMVHQLEAESADRKENGHAGRVPSAFVTLTSAIYKWEQLHTTILKSLPADHEHRGQSLTDTDRHDVNAWRQCPPGSEEREVAMKKAFYVLSLENPGIVAWYCGLKLELGVHLLQQLITRMLQSEVVPGGDEARELLQTQLRAKMGEDSFTVEGELPDLERYGEVDDYYASVEWSAGGIVHAHIALWIVAAPRIDEVQVAREAKDGVVHVEVERADHTVMMNEEAAHTLATFWDRVYTEYNVAKEFATPSVEQVASQRLTAQGTDLRAEMGARSKIGFDADAPLMKKLKTMSSEPITPQK